MREVAQTDLWVRRKGNKREGKRKKMKMRGEKTH
jgi:hypothetical protein